MFYLLTLVALTPPEIAVLATLGVVTLYFVRPLRKHYSWIILSFIPYLVILAIAPKKLTRYASTALPVVIILASAGIEWLAPRFRSWSKRAQLVPLALLALLFLGRYVRAVSLLPESEACTAWPGIECGRPGDKHYMRELALGIRHDWEARGEKTAPSIYLRKASLVFPWLPATRAKMPRNADYIVLWDYEFLDPELGTLSKRSRTMLGKLGPEVVTVTRSGRTVARVFRRAA